MSGLQYLDGSFPGTPSRRIWSVKAMRMHKLPLLVPLPCASVTSLNVFLSCSKQVPICSVHSAPLPALEPGYAPAFPLLSPSGLKIPCKYPHTASRFTHSCCILGRLHPSPDGNSHPPSSSSDWASWKHHVCLTTSLSLYLLLSLRLSWCLRSSQ